MKLRLIVPALLVFVFMTTGFAQAGLIYKKNVKDKARMGKRDDGKAPYSEVEAVKPPSPQQHDLVKVIVREVSNAEAKGSTKIDKETSLDASLKEFVNFHGKDGISSGGLPKISGSASLGMDADASTTKETTFTAVIKAEVVEVLPNGNLIIEAKKVRTINNETETITMTGVIDPDDLDSTGTILSEDVAQMKLSFKGKGSVSDSQRRGILTRVLDFIWPF